MHGTWKASINKLVACTEQRVRDSPGRFFAASELKAMVAHVVLTYDIMMTDKPHTTWIGINRIPDKNAEVLFRKRRV